MTKKLKTGALERFHSVLDSRREVEAEKGEGLSLLYTTLTIQADLAQRTDPELGQAVRHAIERLETMVDETVVDDYVDQIVDGATRKDLEHKLEASVALCRAYGRPVGWSAVGRLATRVPEAPDPRYVKRVGTALRWRDSIIRLLADGPMERHEVRAALNAGRDKELVRLSTVTCALHHMWHTGYVTCLDCDGIERWDVNLEQLTPEQAFNRFSADIV